MKEPLKTAVDVVPGSLRIYRDKKLGDGVETRFLENSGVYRGSLLFKGDKRRRRVAVKVYDARLTEKDMEEARFFAGELRKRGLPAVKMDFVQDEKGRFHQVMPLFVREHCAIKPQQIWRLLEAGKGINVIANGIAQIVNADITPKRDLLALFPGGRYGYFPLIHDFGIKLPEFAVGGFTLSKEVERIKSGTPLYAGETAVRLADYVRNCHRDFRKGFYEFLKSKIQREDIKGALEDIVRRTDALNK
ncbi:TPA: hypothetical protein HA244_05635 [Candidatus Micrarchaeota archaeon]|nr:hypothetical protein [Candidatus Micrarchaeota archaeon]